MTSLYFSHVCPEHDRPRQALGLTSLVGSCVFRVSFVFPVQVSKVSDAFRGLFHICRSPFPQG